MKDEKNIYVCRVCRRHIVTVDLHDGTTPFLIECQINRECVGQMVSSMYRVFDQTIRPTYEWFKPETTEGLCPWTKDHVEKGGLILREVAL